MMMSELKLTDREWGEFFFSQIFSTIQRGKRLTKENQIIGNVPYVSSSSFNNGVDNFISNTENVRFFEHCLTLANSGSVGSAFFQNYKFVASDHITALIANNANKYIYLFLSTQIQKIKDKYSFNREINDKRIKREKIILPIDNQGNPDWQFMEDYIKQIEQDKIKQLVGYYQAKLLDSQLKNDIGGGKILQIQWDSFSIQDICQIHSGKDIYEKERVSGKLPYITATANNNGIGYFVDNHNSTLEQGCISVNRNGSVGYSFYHDYPALFGNDTRKLIPKNKNKYCSIFIALCITSQKDKYGYGYKMGTARLNKQKIMLPIDKNGNPNWQFMEDFIKNIEKDKIETLLSYLNQHNVLAEPSRAEPSRAEPSRAEPSRAEPSRAEPSRNSMGEI